MSFLEKTKKICKENNINPARSKGQNFLIKESVYDEIIKSASLNKNDIVLEVGPGLGFLTEKLAKKVKKVIAVELDDKLAEVLKARLALNGIENVEIINQDIIEVLTGNYRRPNSKVLGLESLGELSNYKIVANLPYNISSIFLRTVFELRNKPSSLTLMLQKEVAERIVAKPGKMSLLSISVQLYAEGEIIINVPGSDFWPSPEVMSAVLSLKLKKDIENIKLDVNEKNFFRMLKFAFKAKRKMLKNNLSAGYQINQDDFEKLIIKIGLNPKARAQDLSLDYWKMLYREIEKLFN